MAAEIIFYGILIYIVYKLVFDFIVPVSHAGRQMKQQFRDAHNHMQQQANAFKQEQPREHQTTTPQRPKNATGEYIDFEEIK
jgi:hypothetical protein